MIANETTFYIRFNQLEITVHQTKTYCIVYWKV